jgi:hypothetical protein
VIARCATGKDSGFMSFAVTPEFYMIPYHLAKKLGLEKATLLERLRQWQKYANAQDWNKDDSGTCWFWHSREDLMEETTLGEWQIKQFVKEFKEKGVIKVEQRGGFDRRAFFQVDLDHEILCPSGGNLPMHRDETSRCMSGKPPDGCGENLPMVPTFRKEIKEEIK